VSDVGSFFVLSVFPHEAGVKVIIQLVECGSSINDGIGCEFYRIV